MTTPKTPKSKLNEALRANLRRRKAQMEDRKAHDAGAAAAAESGVRYSGFAAREKAQAPED
jgi:hypothetical protein